MEVAVWWTYFLKTPVPESSPDINPTGAEPTVLSLDGLFGDFISASETAESDSPPQIQSAPDPLVTSSDSDSDSALFEETAVNEQPPAAEPTSAVIYTTPSLDDVLVARSLKFQSRKPKLASLKHGLPLNLLGRRSRRQFSL